MYYFLKFILGIKLYMFRTVPVSIIRKPDARSRIRNSFYVRSIGY